jgi:radical SAM protein with 4Fe4S-binding SPASM domain
MIDTAKLDKAYREDGIYALQLEVGDVCHQGCIYCYMNALDKPRNTLSDRTITRILHDSARLGVTAIEWLGGEPLLRDSIFNHMELAAELGFKNNMWTGGLPLADEHVLQRTAELTRNGLIAFHLSTINPETYRRLHPDRPASDLEVIITAVKRLLDHGYPSAQLLNSVTFTGLQTAEDMTETIDYFEREFGILTCINVYHTYLRPGQTRRDLERFIPAREEIARVYARYRHQYGVTQMPMNCVNKQYCSATVAVLCDGSVTPCATIRETDAPRVTAGSNLYDIVNSRREYLIFKHLKNDAHLPEECRKCPLTDNCWGCRSRSFAAGDGVFGRDPRCFRGREVTNPRHRYAANCGN